MAGSSDLTYYIVYYGYVYCACVNLALTLLRIYLTSISLPQSRRHGVSLVMTFFVILTVILLALTESGNVFLHKCAVKSLLWVGISKVCSYSNRA